MTSRKPLPPGFELNINGVRYLIEDCIAAGGQSFIYEVKAFHSQGCRQTVLKEYFPAHGAERNAEGKVCPKDITAEKFLSRRAELQQEALAGGMAGNESYQVISLTDFDEQGYAVMPKHSADAVPLATLLSEWDKNGLPSPDPFYADLGRAHYALKITSSMLAGLTTIHNHANIIHCDLSLKNVLWAGADQKTGENCTALFLDFGSAQKLENGQKNIADRKDLPPSTAYITAPELQHTPTVLSFATDIFAVGSLLAALLLGANYTDKADIVRAFNFNALDRKNLPGKLRAELKNLLNTALAENPAERYADAPAMQDKVQELLRLSTPKEYALTCRAAAPVENFIGRQTHKNRLQELLQAGKNPVFITGHGGIGKTELALEFARDKRDEYEIFFTHFQTDLTETILGLDFDGLRETEQETIENISRENIDKTPEEIADLIRQARYELRLECLSRYDNGTVLIIDNFDPEDFNAIRSSKPYKDLTALALKTIFTTRRQIENAAVVDVAELTEQDLLQLIKSYYATGQDDILLDLIREVEGHTLTVDIIGRTLKQGEKWGTLTPQSLLNLLRSHDYNSEQLQQVESDYGRSKPDETDNYAPQRILGHLQKVFRVSELSMPAKMILSCTSLLPTSGLPVKLFMPTAAARKQDIETLELCGWLNIKSGSISMHPLVKEVCLHDESTKPTWENTHIFSEQLAVKWSELHQKAAADTMTHEQILHTLQAAIKTPATNPKGKPINHGLLLYEACGDICQFLGRYAEALSYMHWILQMQKQMKQVPHLNRAMVLAKCAGCHIILGELEPALAALTDSLNIKRKLLPPNHMDIAATLSALSTIYAMQGNDEKAQELLAEAGQISADSAPQQDENQPAEEYKYLLQLGTAYIAAEEYDQAITHLQLALQKLPPDIPRDHPEVAISIASLGSAFLSKGDFDNAAACLNEAIDYQRRSLAPNHPQLLGTLTLLSNLYTETEQREKALTVQKEIIDIMRPNQSNNFALKYTDMLQLAALTAQELGLYSQANEFLSEAAEIMKNTDAPAEEFTDLMLTMASVLLDDKDLQGAKTLYLNAIERMQKDPNVDQNELAMTMYNLGITHTLLGSNGEALIWFGRALGAYRLNPDADPLDTADAMAAIGRTMLRMNNGEDARDYFEQALDIYEYILPKDAPEIMNIREKLLMLEPISDLPLQ